MREIRVVTAALLTLAMAPVAHGAQGGPDAFGNTYIDSDEPGGPAFDWDDLEDVGNALSLLDEDDAQVDIGFLFDFYGVTYDQLTVQSNGALTFDDHHLGYLNGGLPESGPPARIIAAFWDDLNPEDGGQIYHATLGTAPNRVFVVQWKDVPHFGSYAEYDFEVCLYESTGGIVLQYDHVVDGYGYDQGASATVGIQGETSAYLQYSHDTASLSDGLAILFEPCEPLDDDGDGVSTCDGDCDDADPGVYPGAPELCDGLDNDCDGIANDLLDADSDGFSICDGDCDDTEPGTYPGAPEPCDGLDNDCDDLVDEDPQDLDGDGITDCDGDCDDDDPAVYPGAPDICDGVDSDCNGDLFIELDDDGDGYAECDGDCDDDDSLTHPGAAELCDGLDNDCDPATDEDDDEDGDSYSACDGDCDDGAPTVHPDGQEICDDGKDNDCDGSFDLWDSECFGGEGDAEEQADGGTFGCTCRLDRSAPGPRTNPLAACLGGLLVLALYRRRT